MGGTGTFSGVSLRWSWATDVGCKRKINEDAAIACPPVFLVADGMGGHDAGDVASAMVVERFRSLTSEQIGDLPSSEMISGLLKLANDDVHSEGMGRPSSRSMGTTAVGLALVSQSDTPMWMLFNVGDSRVYRYFDGQLELLSTDHSYVQELVAAGTLTSDAARVHPQRNVVTRAIGVDEAVEPDLWTREPFAGERFLLCSDGLTTEVDEAWIADRLSAPGDPQSAVENLVADALAAGGRDNVTVIIVDVDAVAETEGHTTAPRGMVADDELSVDHHQVSVSDEELTDPVPSSNSPSLTLISGMPASLSSEADPAMADQAPGPKFMDYEFESAEADPPPDVEGAGDDVVEVDQIDADTTKSEREVGSSTEDTYEGPGQCGGNHVGGNNVDTDD